MDRQCCDSLVPFHYIEGTPSVFMTLEKNSLKTCSVFIVFYNVIILYDPVDTGRKFNVHKTFRRRPGRLLNVLCTFNLRPVSMGRVIFSLETTLFDDEGLTTPQNFLLLHKFVSFRLPKSSLLLFHESVAHKFLC